MWEYSLQARNNCAHKCELCHKNISWAISRPHLPVPERLGGSAKWLCVNRFIAEGFRLVLCNTEPAPGFPNKTKDPFAKPLKLYRSKSSPDLFRDLCDGFLSNVSRVAEQLCKVVLKWLYDCRSTLMCENMAGTGFQKLLICWNNKIFFYNLFLEDPLSVVRARMNEASLAHIWLSL